MQFSCSVNESSVQFIDPVQTRCPSTTMYLWCMSVPKPITGPHVEAEGVDVLGRRGRAGHVVGHLALHLALVVVEDAHAHAAVAQRLQRRGDARRLGVLHVEVVDRDRDVLLCRGEEGDQRAGDVRDRLAPLAQEAKLESRRSPRRATAGDGADLCGRVYDLQEREVVLGDHGLGQQAVRASSPASRSSSPSRRARRGSA